MATTKITSQVLDLNAGRPDYSLAATNTVTYVGSSGGNQYVFNGNYGVYGVVNGTYVLSSVSSSHPIAIINNGKTSEISYTGAVDEGTATGPDGNTYTFYSGDVTITVSGNFDTVSYYCKFHGYMGGKDNLIYTNSIGDSGLKMPSGNRSDRPTGVAGAIRNNTQESMNGSSSALEYYNGSEWKFLEGPAPTIDFMIVSGGGQGGGGFYGGGGGAGGLRTSYGSTSGGGATAETGITLSAGTYTVTIGAGGTGGGGTSSFYQGFPGNGSSIQPPLATQVTSIGGGGGGGGGGCGTCRNPLDGRSGGDGGCGGGGSASNQSSTYGNGFPGQGYHGGAGSGGGGGTGEVGEVGASGPGPGGDGLAVSITGTSVNYGGGGGAGGNGTFSQGGAGGGGRGGVRFQNNQAPGSANTGGGGGGAGNNTEIGANGGSGIVILRIPTSSYSGATTGSPTVTIDGTDTIIKYTGSGTYVHS
ncbi:MAG: hypothetical protein GY920_08510 [Aliivibrio sp.]|nr:hypothetical protein [Aliivibrio sp.]